MKYFPNFAEFFKGPQLTIIDQEAGGGSTEIQDYHDHDGKHEEKHHHRYCCDKPDVPVVGKIFEFCDEKRYKLEKFEQAIREYYELYPYVLIKYEKVYPKHKKCTVRYCVWFSLLDYEKAFEIEKSLQKKYRYLLLH